MIVNISRNFLRFLLCGFAVLNYQYTEYILRSKCKHIDNMAERCSENELGFAPFGFMQLQIQTCKKW